MARSFGKVVIPVIRVENGFLRTVVGATAVVYAINPDSPEIDDAGNITGSPSLQTIYSDRKGASPIAGSMVTSDARGNLNFYAGRGNFGLVITAPDGQKMGMPIYVWPGDPRENFYMTDAGWLINVLESLSTAPVFQLMHNSLIRMEIRATNRNIAFRDGTGLVIMFEIPADGTPIQVHKGMTFNIGDKVLILPVEIGDPAGVGGKMYYNSSTNQIRVFNGAWRGVTLT